MFDAFWFQLKRRVAGVQRDAAAHGALGAFAAAAAAAARPPSPDLLRSHRRSPGLGPVRGLLEQLEPQVRLEPDRGGNADIMF